MLLPLRQALANTIENSYLIVTATCRNNPSCTFYGRDMEIEVTIRNVGEVVVGYPLQYVVRRGPAINLTDNITRKTRPLRINLASRKLMQEFAAVRPGHSVTLDATIPRSAILALASKDVDVTAEIMPAANIRVAGHSALLPFRGTAKLLIKGSDTNPVMPESQDRNLAEWLSGADEVDVLMKMQRHDAQQRVLLVRKRSNDLHPAGYCGAGYEDYLVLASENAGRLVYSDRFLIQSCLQSITPQSDYPDDIRQSIATFPERGSIEFQWLTIPDSRRHVLSVVGSKFSLSDAQ